jgi:ligand-binding SRPBCC domain-containing protein
MHIFRVHAPLSAVADFHAQSASMGAITPPPLVTQVHQAPPRLKEGDKMDFTLWLGPLAINWVACIENVSPNGFDDRQICGPFRHWIHRHRFITEDDQTTKVVDEIEASLKRHPWWGLVGLGMWLGLPMLFAYRGWKTRRLLEKMNYELDQNSSQK